MLILLISNGMASLHTLPNLDCHKYLIIYIVTATFFFFNSVLPQTHTQLCYKNSYRYQLNCYGSFTDLP